MSVALEPDIGTAHAATSQIPELPQLGRISTRLARRTLLIYLAFCVLGTVPLMLNASTAWQIFGLGLWVPGGGFIASGGWNIVGFVATLLLFGIAYLLWFVIGSIWFMPLVWLVSAGIAAATAGEVIVPYSAYVVPAIPITLLLVRQVFTQRRIVRQRRTREELNAILPAAITAVHSRAVPAQAVGTRELTPDQIAALRFAYDRALQPLAEFNGFNVIDQFREAAIRYQLNNLGFALALAQCHYLPNFHGYLSRAQRNLIDKMRDRRVWSYWRVENLLGNLSLDCDPIGRDNIMLGGFYNAQIGLYAANTGDMRYGETGALPFALHERKVFNHDMHSIAAVSRRNFESSPFSLYPCEPTFSYSYCNLQGLTGIHLNDRVFGTRHASEIVPAFRRNFENEFMDLDGGIIASRNNWTGLRFHSFDATWTRAAYCWLMNGHFPDLSERMWAILREQRIRFDDKGELDLDISSWIERLDIGNYSFTGPLPFVQLLVAASEHGDREVADAALRGLNKHHAHSGAGGILAYLHLSTFSNGLVIMGRLMQRHDWRNVIHRGPPATAFHGPLLTEARYPDVLVARAWSDGADLSLVLYPGSENTNQGLQFERLLPGQRYAVTSTAGDSRIQADNQGHGRLVIDLRGRTALHLAPVQ
ncbi:MAG: hypothetical protein ABW034_10765 [Steroidobacteraceae bacterium]